MLIIYVDETECSCICLIDHIVCVWRLSMEELSRD